MNYDFVGSGRADLAAGSTPAESIRTTGRGRPTFIMPTLCLAGANERNLPHQPGVLDQDSHGELAGLIRKIQVTDVREF